MQTHCPMMIPQPLWLLYHPLEHCSTSRLMPKTSMSTESMAAQLAAPPTETRQHSLSCMQWPACMRIMLLTCHKMAKFCMEPPPTKMLIASVNLGCSDAMTHPLIQCNDGSDAKGFHGGNVCLCWDGVWRRERRYVLHHVMQQTQGDGQ